MIFVAICFVEREGDGVKGLGRGEFLNIVDRLERLCRYSSWFGLLHVMVASKTDELGRCNFETEIFTT